MHANKTAVIQQDVFFKNRCSLGV